MKEWGSLLLNAWRSRAAIENQGLKSELRAMEEALANTWTPAAVTQSGPPIMPDGSADHAHLHTYPAPIGIPVPGLPEPAPVAELADDSTNARASVQHFFQQAYDSLRDGVEDVTPAAIKAAMDAAAIAAGRADLFKGGTGFDQKNLRQRLHRHRRALG